MVASRTGIYAPLREARIDASAEDYWIVSFTGEGSLNSVKKFWKALAPKNPFVCHLYKIIESGQKGKPVWLAAGVLPDSGTRMFDEWAIRDYFGFSLIDGRFQGNLGTFEEILALDQKTISVDAINSMIALAHQSPEIGWEALLRGHDKQKLSYSFSTEGKKMAQIIRGHIKRSLEPNKGFTSIEDS